jgi:hypothetical protein
MAIQIKRGAAGTIPTGATGEPLWTTDTHQLYIGTGSGNVLIGPNSSVLTTKGDIETFSTVVTRLGVGVDGTILTADSAQATGIKWAVATWLTNPMTTLGDIIYENATPAAARLAGNTTTTKKFLTQTGTGTISAAPAWSTIVAADVPDLSANPTASVGLSAVNGSATTYMRSDAAPALSQSIAPTWTGLHTWTYSDAATNAATTILTVGHTSSGTAAAGFGTTILYNLQSSTTAGRSAADVTITWATATDASRKARVVHNVYDTAAREFLRGEASGTAAMIGFLGAAAVAAQTGDVGTAMVTFGLMTGTPTFAEVNLSLTDNSTNNVSTTKHGFAPKAPNDATKYLDGTGFYSVPAGSTTFPTKFVEGFNLIYSGATDILVRAGACRDKSDAANISMTDDFVDLSFTTGALASIGKSGVTGGLDRTIIGGTVTTNGTTALVGASTHFLTDFGTRNLVNGTIGTSGASTTTITGTNTKFLSEVAVGDVIGPAAGPMSRVTAIASDTSLTVITALNMTNGQTGVVVENAFVQAGLDIRQIDLITDDTHITSHTAFSNGGGSLNCYKAPLPNAQTHLMIWAGTGASGTGVFVSTQRTSPSGISGYTSNFRRIGSVMWTGSAVIAFDQWGGGLDRWYQFEDILNTDGARIVSAATATGWTGVVGSGIAPPTAAVLRLLAVLTGAAATDTAYLRCRNRGSATTQRTLRILTPSASGYASCDWWAACDGAQGVEYANAVGTNSFFLDVGGYKENLLK